MNQAFLKSDALSTQSVSAQNMSLQDSRFLVSRASNWANEANKFTRLSECLAFQSASVLEKWHCWCDLAISRKSQATTQFRVFYQDAHGSQVKDSFVPVHSLSSSRPLSRSFRGNERKPCHHNYQRQTWWDYLTIEAFHPP